LLLLHIKDVESPVPSDPKLAYRFVELGRGRVNIQAVFAALGDIGFGGWAVVELDAVPDPTRTPKESAAISKRYLETIGVSLN
jgi:inosose dehydratase